MTKHRYFALAATVLTIALSFNGTPAHAQWPPWEYINSPEMTAFTQVAVNDGNSVFYTCGSYARIATLPCSFADVRMDVPEQEIPRLRIALDTASRPWMISDRHF